MSNALYNKAKEKFLQAGALGPTSGTSIQLVSDTINVALIDTGVYTFNAADEFYTAISAAVIGTPVALSGKAVTNGVFSASSALFTAVSGSSIEALVFYKDTGSAASSSLIYFMDTVASGLPLTPNGGNVTANWNASGIFTL